MHGPRVEAHDKVTGRAKYTVDIKHPGQLEGVILRSAHAHARVLALDLSAARQKTGVKAVVSLLGRDRMVRFAGQEIAALAAGERRTAVEALAAIVVRYEPMADRNSPGDGRRPCARARQAGRASMGQTFKPLNR